MKSRRAVPFSSFCYRDLLFALVYGALFVGLFWESYPVMFTWWQAEDYNYCYLIPLIFLYLVWEKKETLAAVPAAPCWLGLVPIGFGILLYLLGELGGEYFSLFLSSWFLFVGLILLHLGRQKVRVLLFPLLFLIAMFPLPQFLNNKISLSLKLVSSKLGVWLLQQYGMSAYREGNVIDLGFTQLQVVDACSGLRYLIPLIVLGILLAYFFKAALWKRIFIVLSTVPLSIITNSLRIASVGILYQYWGPAVAEGFFHDFSGWFIFMFTLGVLLVEMWLLKKIFPGPSQTLKESGYQGLNIEGAGDPFKRLKEQKPEVHSWGALPHFIVAVLLLGGTFGAAHGIEFRENIPIKKSLAEFPLQMGGWSGQQTYMEKQFLDELDLSEYVIVDFQDADHKSVNFYVAYYASQRKGESIHSPESCLPGSGWVFNESGRASIPLAGNGQKPLRVNRAFMQKGSYKQLSYYWFPMRGRNLTSAYEMKLYTFWDALTRQRTDGALVRLITPVYNDESLQAAEQRLQSFTRELAPVLAGYLPE